MAAADGSEISVSPPTVEHRTYDQFGRGLAFSGQRLLVGAPDHSSTLPLAGRAELWAYSADAWQRETEWTPPVPDFSVSAERQAAGRLGSRAGATGLSSRVRLVPRSRYEEWLDSRQTTAGRLPLNDADSDGLPSLLEYVFNLHPSSSGLPPATAAPTAPSGVPPASMATNATSHTFTFVRPLPDPRLTVVVESSGDMSSWIEESGTPEILASGTTQGIATLTTAAATTRWWRLKARYRED